jgi:YrbI family 3-deoxy-D-manno-octulosonate 8-phosphate phosphatase
MNSKIMNKMKNIKLVLTDVDGVLTDGGMYYSSKGDIMKKFFVRDGMGVTLLKKNGINTVIVTKEKNQIITQWFKKMKVKKLYDGVLDKGGILNKICVTFNVKPKEICYLGDDVNDIGIMKKCGLSISPKNAVKEVKKIADYVSEIKGGEGVFRDTADLILTNKFGSKKITY